ncbi:receptor activity-modifying protein 3 isoform X1 [Pithys albifrons albifrons]
MGTLMVSHPRAQECVEPKIFGVCSLGLIVFMFQPGGTNVNGLMTLGFAGARQRTDLCNESLMLEKLPACGKSFEEMMKKVDSKKWCNLTEFIMYYDNFTQCTEREANNASCFWPNPLAEGFITGIHKQFFSNCTSEKVHWEDPPDEILITLILIPVMLTCAMITLVVWCSKRSDILV